MTVDVLFARADSNYKAIPSCELYDMQRDARTYDGSCPVVAYPPCRARGRLRAYAAPRPDERNLGRLAVALLREFWSTRYTAPLTAQKLPASGSHDAYGGWTLAAKQKW
jgi:hypothetical protein